LSCGFDPAIGAFYVLNEFQAKKTSDGSLDFFHPLINQALADAVSAILADGMVVAGSPQVAALERVLEKVLNTRIMRGVLAAAAEGGVLPEEEGWGWDTDTIALGRWARLLNIINLILSLTGDTPQNQLLFRVVSDEELAVTIASQGLVPDINNFGKEVWLYMGDARWFAELNINRAMNRTIIQMAVSPATLSLGTQGSDIGHTFWHFDNSVLEAVNASIRAHGGIVLRDRYKAE
jgi:hypothetical protein